MPSPVGSPSVRGGQQPKPLRAPDTENARAEGDASTSLVPRGDRPAPQSRVRWQSTVSHLQQQQPQQPQQQSQQPQQQQQQQPNKAKQRASEARQAGDPGSDRNASGNEASGSTALQKKPAKPAGREVNQRDVALIRVLYREAKRFFASWRHEIELALVGSSQSEDEEEEEEEGQQKRSWQEVLWAQPPGTIGKRSRAEVEDAEGRPSRASYVGDPTSQWQPPLSMLHCLGIRAMVKAVRIVRCSRLLVEECQEKVKQKKAMQAQSLQAKPFVEAGDFRSVESILKQAASELEEQADDPDDEGFLRLKEAVSEAAARAEQLAVLKDYVSELAPLIQAIPEALDKIKTEIHRGANSSASEPKQMKKMLSAVVQAESVLEQTRAVQDCIPPSVRSFNARLSDVGCIPAPTCVFGHHMSLRGIDKEGKVFCDACAASRSAQEGVVPYIWHCDVCARERRIFHYCKDCGVKFHDAQAISRCQPSKDWDYLIKVADQALEATHEEIALSPTSGIGDKSMADALQEIRRDSIASLSQARRRSLARQRRSSLLKARSGSLAASDSMASSLTPSASRQSTQAQNLDDLARSTSSFMRSKRTSSLRRLSTGQSQPRGEEEQGEDPAEKERSMATAMEAEGDDEEMGSEDTSDLEDAITEETDDSEEEEDSEDSDEDDRRRVLLNVQHSLGRRMGVFDIATLRISASKFMRFAKAAGGQRGEASSLEASSLSRTASMAFTSTFNREDTVESSMPNPVVMPQAASQAPARSKTPPQELAPLPANRPLPAPEVVLPKPVVKSEAELRLEQLRMQIMDLGPSSAVSPRGQPKKIGMADAGLPQDDVMQLILPPLKPIKAYVPASARRAVDEEATQLRQQQQQQQAGEVRLPPLAHWDPRMAAHHPRNSGWQGVKESRLGSVALPWQRLPQSSSPRMPLSARNATHLPHRDGLPQQWHRRAVACEEASLFEDEDDGLMRCRTVAWTPGMGHKIRGKDPMAGSLFGRETVLDRYARQRGLYDAQMLHQRHPEATVAAAPSEQPRRELVL